MYVDKLAHNAYVLYDIITSNISCGMQLPVTSSHTEQP